MSALTVFQQDAISELLNIGMGRAAASLSHMVHEKIKLSLPVVSFLEKHSAIACIEKNAGTDIISVKSNFNGVFWGDALIIFPQNQDAALAKVLTNSLGEGDTALQKSIGAMKDEVITEAGNVILHACLGSLANIFKQKLTFKLPLFQQGNCSEILNNSSLSSHCTDNVLLLKMNFELDSTKISGYFIMLLDKDSMSALTQQLDHHFSDIY